MVTGTNINSLTFKVFLRSDRVGSIWSTTGNQVGGWTIGISVPTANVTVLPLALSDFTATAFRASVQLKWQTATEENSGFFDIESSSEGSNWQDIGMSGRASSMYLVTIRYVSGRAETIKIEKN